MYNKFFFTVLLTLFFGLTSLGQIFITELADPNDDATARYVEIYNGGTTTVDVTGWTLRRYTNDDTVPQTKGEDLTPIGFLGSRVICNHCCKWKRF